MTLVPRNPKLPSRIPGSPGFDLPRLTGPDIDPDVDVPRLPGPTSPDVDPPAPGSPMPPRRGMPPAAVGGIAGAIGVGLGAGIRSLLGTGQEQQQDAGAPQGPPTPPLHEAGPPAHIRRRQWMRQQKARYADQIATNPALFDEMVGQYDAAMKKPGARHIDGVKGAYDLETELLANKDAQIRLNVQNQAKQINTARQFGVPRGWVMAHEDVIQSLNKGDMASASAKAAMYGNMYGPTWLMAAKNITDQNVAASEARGKAAEAAAQAKPPQKDPIEALREMQAQIDQLPPGPLRQASINSMHRLRLGGEKADPAELAEAIKGHYQPIIQGYARRGFQGLSPDELIEAQKIITGMKPDEWAQYSGLPRALADRAYQQLTGKNAGWSQFFQNFFNNFSGGGRPPGPTPILPPGSSPPVKYYR